MDSPRSLRQLGIDCLVKTRRCAQSEADKSNCLHFGTFDSQPQHCGLPASSAIFVSKSRSSCDSIIFLSNRRHSISGSYPSVDCTVTTQAERDQIAFIIDAGVAAKLFVVDLQVCHRTAQLTAPAVSPQYVLAELLVILLLEPDRRLFLLNLLHWICSFTICRNACR